MKSIATSLIALTLFAICWIPSESSYGQLGRGGRGGGRRGGGGMRGRTPSMSRPAPRPMPRPNYRPPTGLPNTRPSIPNTRPNLPNTRPSIPNTRPNFPNTRPSIPNTRPNLPNSRPLPPGIQPGNRPITRPTQPPRQPQTRPLPGSPSTRPSRPSDGKLGDFLDLKRPSNPSRPSNDGPLGDFMNRPTRPSQPSTRPAPGTGDRPGINPPGSRPPGKNPPSVNPPGKNPPGNRPPGKNPPGNRPPGKNPPGNRPPGKNPPGNRPPGKNPPGNRPPGNRPPGNRPPNRPNRPPNFGGGFWRPHWHWHWYSYSYNWWAPATALEVTDWFFSGGIGQPYYYDYGDNLYYQDGSVYVEGTPVATEEQYAEGAKEIADNVPKVDPDKVEWLPLGVFAIVQKDDAVSVKDSNMFLQLAISREGIIAGTFQDTSSDNAFEVEGTIDKDSQRAAWGPVGKEWPIMQTGIFNLTKDETGVLLHFEDGSTQHWKLVRILEAKKDSPKKDAAATSEKK